MSELMDVINAFGTPLKLAWVGWIAWGVGQYLLVPARALDAVVTEGDRRREARGEEAGRAQAGRRAGGRSAGRGTAVHADARRRGREAESRSVGRAAACAAGADAGCRSRPLTRRLRRSIRRRP